MLRYILKRLLSMIPTLFGITFVTFLMINLAPGDPVEASLGGQGGPGAEAGGGSDGADRKSDAIKTKKKLLGILTEEYAVLAWNAAQQREEPTEDDSSFYQIAAPFQRNDQMVSQQ